MEARQGTTDGHDAADGLPAPTPFWQRPSSEGGAGSVTLTSIAA